MYIYCKYITKESNFGSNPLIKYFKIFSLIYKVDIFQISLKFSYFFVIFHGGSSKKFHESENKKTDISRGEEGAAISNHRKYFLMSLVMMQIRMSLEKFAKKIKELFPSVKFCKLVVQMPLYI